MTPVLLSEAAADDLDAILDHGTVQFGIDVATKYISSFSEAFTMIADHPRIGAIHDTVRPPVHSLPHGSHRIFYDVIDDTVVVQRVLHKAMDPIRHL